MVGILDPRTRPLLRTRRPLAPHGVLALGCRAPGVSEAWDLLAERQTSLNWGGVRSQPPSSASLRSTSPHQLPLPKQGGDALSGESGSGGARGRPPPPDFRGARGDGHQGLHQQCDVNYFEIRRALGPTTVWSYAFHRRIDGEGMRPYEMLPIPTDLEIVHITLLVAFLVVLATCGVANWRPEGSPTC